MKPGRIVVIAGTLMLVLTCSVGWIKVSPIATRCPEGAKRSVDADGDRDLCVFVEAPVCAEDLVLREDAVELLDVCVPADLNADSAPASEIRPTCPNEFTYHVQEGPDECRKSAKTECRKGFHLKVLPGEDKCVR